MLKQLEYVASYPTIKWGLRLILLTLLRKGKLIHATGDEFDFENALWAIPKARMKAGKAHNIHLDDHPGANDCGTNCETNK